MQDFTQFFLYIPGIVIFLLGSGQARTWFSIVKNGSAAEGTIVRSEHVVKKDNKGRDTFNYYNTVVEYLNPKTGHNEQHAIKTPTEYAPGQQVRLVRSSSVNDVTILDAEENSIFHPLVITVGGALMILLALWQNQGKDVYAMTTLAVILAGAGICMIWHYLGIIRRHLVPIEAEIVDTYTRQISKSTKIIRGDKFTYYPIVKYSVSGRDNILRCHMNADSEKQFTIGNTITLYYDEAAKRITEKKAQISTLIIGIALTLLGVLVGLSVIGYIFQ